MSTVPFVYIHVEELSDDKLDNLIEERLAWLYTNSPLHYTGFQQQFSEAIAGYQEAVTEDERVEWDRYIRDLTVTLIDMVHSITQATPQERAELSRRSF